MSNPDKAAQAPVNSTDSIGPSEDLMEAQLQQELRSMFEVDTQKGLQTYLDQATGLQPQTWSTDIQTLYRTIHTIKGGAVTVGADAILQVATVLEDLLSDLRHLETAPPLEDGQLQEMLVESGELLASTLPIEVRGEAARAQVEPSVQRIQQVRSQIQQAYLPQWSEQKHIQQEFAQQGLDLVVLDLEIALEQLADQTTLPDSIIRIARHVTDQLYHIGQDLQLSSGWLTLLRQAETLMAEFDVELWRSQWPRLFQALKTCAQEEGKPVPFAITSTEGSAEQTPAPGGNQATDLAPAAGHEQLTATSDINNDELFTDVSAFLDSLGDFQESLSATSWPAPTATQAHTAAPPTAAVEVAGQATDAASSGELMPELDTLIIDLGTDGPETDQEATPSTAINAHPAPTSEAADTNEQIQVPVPLERLDQSAQALINTLLSVRSTQALYQVLQNQIVQLVSLAQEEVHYITRLRQIQDDYALMNSLRFSLKKPGPTPERYRQGYTTINRLLETSLRLSELGAEAEKSARQMNDSLQFLDSSVLKLQTTVEESRLTPFRNLAFRARAILRDLTTRFQKPARLVIQGERTELDVGTTRSLEPILLHLIRNAFDHAMESPEERRALGKTEQGTLTLALRRQGNTYRLDVQDDGRGLNADAIRERAVTLGLPLTNTDTPANLLAVICQPGFSSETKVSTISGRGVGMDVVANQVAKLGGQLSLDTALGQGTTFHLQFPVPRLLEPCILLQAGDRTFAMPVDDIKTLALLESLQANLIQEFDNIYSWQIETNDIAIPGLDLLEYWQPQLITRPLADSTICILIELPTGDQSIWLLADELIGQYDLLINPLPTPLKAPEGVMGVSLQPDGTLVPVLNAIAIAEWLHQIPEEAIADLSGLSDLNLQETVISTPTILIVDDAALVRRRLEASLTANGHATHTCADGLEALNWLQSNPNPALVITDIEMPNMDGFTLIDRCRQEGMRMPILVVSSRLSEDWFDEAKRLGADDYLTKGFSTLELMNKVNQLLSQEQRKLLY